MSKYKPYTKYKDSGIEWLGEIPEGWEAKKLKYISTVNDDVLPDSTSGEEEIKYIDIGSVTTGYILNYEHMLYSNAPSRAKRIIKTGDILVSTVRTYLKAIAPVSSEYDNYIASTGFAVIRSNKELNSTFTEYALLSNYFVDLVESHSVGVSYPAINSSNIMTFNIALPPLQEQKTIDNYLDKTTVKIDNLIEKQTRLIALLKEKRQAVISTAVTRGLDSSVPMKESGVEWLGEIPVGWKTPKLKLFITTTKGFAFKSDDFIEEGIPVVKMSEIKNGTINKSSVFLPKTFQFTHKQVLLRYKDIIVSTVGSAPEVKNSAVGQIGIVPREHDGSLLNQNTVVYSPNKTLLSNNYLPYVLNSQAYREHLDIYAHGTANQASLNLVDMLKFVFPSPSLKEQEKIANYLDDKTQKIDNLITKATKAIDLLKERRTALISAVVTGKVDVRGGV